MNTEDKLTKEELTDLADILETFEVQSARDTGVKWLNGGYAKAEMFDYDEDKVDIELEWGEENMGDGRSVAHKECYTLDRKLITANIDVMEKIANIEG